MVTLLVRNININRIVQNVIAALEYMTAKKKQSKRGTGGQTMKLESCPFCGSDKVAWTPIDEERYDIIKEGFIWCHGCDFTSDIFSDLKSAAEKWNRRTEPMRYGKWVLLRSGDWTSVYGCSVCKRRVTVGCDKDKALDRVKTLYPYCHCGAKMDLED